MIRQSQFIALQTRVYIVPCHTIALMWLDACTVHALFTRTSQSLIRATLSVTRIKLLLKILFCLLIVVNAGPLVPQFFVLHLDACSFTGYQESGLEYLEGSPHGRGSPNIPHPIFPSVWRTEWFAKAALAVLSQVQSWSPARWLSLVISISAACTLPLYWQRHSLPVVWPVTSTGVLPRSWLHVLMMSLEFFSLMAKPSCCSHAQYSSKRNHAEEILPATLPLRVPSVNHPCCQTHPTDLAFTPQSSLVIQSAAY